jgi:hypothetical protein
MDVDADLRLHEDRTPTHSYDDLPHLKVSKTGGRLTPLRTRSARIGAPRAPYGFLADSQAAGCLPRLRIQFASHGNLLSVVFKPKRS